MATTSNWSKKIALASIIVGLILLVIAGAAALGYSQRPHRRPPIPRSTDVSLIEDWMTVPYVARAYRVPEQTLLDALHLTADEARHQSLADVARSRHEPPEQVLAIVRSVVLQDQASRPTPPPEARPTRIGAGP